MVKIRFRTDMFYGGDLLFTANQVYEIDPSNGWLDRWLKRGAEIVEEIPLVNETIIVEPVVETEIVVEQSAPEIETDFEPTPVVKASRGRKPKFKMLEDI